MGPKFNDWCPYKRKGHRDTCKERPFTWASQVKADWSDAATSQGMPEATRSWKRQEGSSPRAFRGSITLTTCFQTSDLQSCDRIHYCCFKPRLWQFVTAATPFPAPQPLSEPLILIPPSPSPHSQSLPILRSAFMSSVPSARPLHSHFHLQKEPSSPHHILPRRL